MPLANEPSFIDQLLLRTGEAANHYAGTLAAAFNEFWNRDPSVVIAELNVDVQRYLTIFALNEQAANGVNPALEAFDSPRFTNRAPINMPEGFTFDQNLNLFTYSDPVVSP